MKATDVRVYFSGERGKQRLTISVADEDVLPLHFVY